MPSVVLPTVWTVTTHTTVEEEVKATHQVPESKLVEES